MCVWYVCVFVMCVCNGSTENARLENEGQKWNNGMKYVDWKMQDK